MNKLGTDYGGWYFPEKHNLNQDSIIYSAGVGEDISFDLKIQNDLNCNIFLIDPTIKSITHYDECKHFFTDKSFAFTGNIQHDYINYIQNLNPNFKKFNYLNIGLWDKKDELKFYKQTNENYVSQSLIDGMFGNNYDLVPVNSIKNIMNELNHTKIDVLKLDIEGAEIKVLEQMLKDNIFPNILCIEFDLKLKNKDTDNSTINLIQLLSKHQYIILKNDNWNITFQKL
tara:strand:+ start:5694 stop:6377 length:684 start_codon:yes stop_codon:yes gene_type:complete